MLFLVCYDVNTESKAGRRRLRRIAKVCEGTGQRVQNSVFECQVTLAEFEALERKLVLEMSIEEDNLRLYQIPESRGYTVKEYGNFKAIDFEAPLIC